ncbi:YciI family protein [Solirubrobacter taibaiensis]|nr:YciI family protein [Solirubrobacter taibaiensis]
MEQWVYFIHAPREHFADTMTEDEQAVWGEHMQLLVKRLEAGSLILAGPTLGPVNTGICVFEAPDEDAALAYMNEDPTIASGIARGELRPFRAAFLRA